MPNGSQRDRTPQLVELTKTPWPVSPLNVSVVGSLRPGVFDITWDDPSQSPLNSRFQLYGVNLYRSHDSEFGPFDRITEIPLGSTFWRDQTDNVLVQDEIVSDNFLLRGECSASGLEAPRYVFQTRYAPIVREGSQKIIASNPLDVRVFVDGVETQILQVFGATGEVEIDTNVYTDVVRQKLVQPLLPGPDSVVTCTYRYTRDLLKTDLSTRVFYRVTTVAISPDGTQLIETPLEQATSANSFATEKLDYIWTEAIRRNRFILEQGGERVKLFIRKTVGLQCPCIPDDYHGQPLNDCRTCFGVGIVGGYEGPFGLIVAPPDAERKISQRDIGRTVELNYEAWTGPTPLLSHRDFLVKLNGERYSVGGVRIPSNRGNVLQQHFNIQLLDEKDIRYSVPLMNPTKFLANQFVPDGPEYSAESGPTDKPGVPEERQLRGLTQTWVNIEY